MLHYVISEDQTNLTMHKRIFVRNLIIAFLGIFTFVHCSQEHRYEGSTEAGISLKSRSSTTPDFSKMEIDPVNHSGWDILLKDYVNDLGLVNYKGFIADSTKLNEYLTLLSANAPDPKTWSESAQLAYWINAYNAFTIQLVIRNYPVNSIKDIAEKIPLINTPWDIKFIRIGENDYDLNNIEHGIIRKQFNEERIHFALVCAAVSCPHLRKEAYTAAKLNDQLYDQAKTFFNDKTINKISENKAVISPILKWYSSDFRDKAKDLRAYINKYSEVEIDPGVKITYADYDWTLNEQK